MRLLLVVLVFLATISLPAGTRAQEQLPPAQAALSAAKTFMHEDFTLHVGGQSFTKKRIDWGAKVDVKALTRALVLSRAAGEDMPRISAHVRKEALWNTLVAIKDAADTKPTPTRYVREERRVVQGRAGINLSLRQTFARIVSAMRYGDREVEAAYDDVSPPRVSEDSPMLTSNAFDEQLAHFSTSYDGRKKNRTFNLRVATDKIDGHLLQPREVFDFNELVGERSETNGFRVAPVIASGELVDGIGGGTCQVSGTLHAAVFFAGLEILERKPHSRPSSYIKLGLDAAVSYPNLNFRFRNNTEMPIAISMRVEGGRVYAEIYAAKRTRDVTFRREITELIPFEVQEDEDPSLPAGVRVLRQRGTPGFRVTRIREIAPAEQPNEHELLAVADANENTDSQPQTVSDTPPAALPDAVEPTIEEVEDYYPPTTEIWSLGTGGPAPEGYEPPPGDQHREYTADAKLIMYLDDDGSRYIEQKELGISGRSGWTDQYRAGSKYAAKP